MVEGLGFYPTAPLIYHVNCFYGCIEKSRTASNSLHSHTVLLTDQIGEYCKQQRQILRTPTNSKNDSAFEKPL